MVSDIWPSFFEATVMWKVPTLDPIRDHPATINTSVPAATKHPSELLQSRQPIVHKNRPCHWTLSRSVSHIFLLYPRKSTPLLLRNRNPHQNGAAYPATSANPAGRAKHSSSSINNLMDVYARVKHHEWHVEISEPARKESWETQQQGLPQ